MDLSQIDLSQIIIVITTLIGIAGAIFGGTKATKVKTVLTETKELLEKIQEVVADNNVSGKELEEVSKEVKDIIELFKKDKNLK